MSELTTLFGNIANAIRAKGGTSGNIQAANFPAAISQLSGAEFGHSAGTPSKNPSSSSTNNCVTIPDLIGKKNVAIILDAGVSGLTPYAFTVAAAGYFANSDVNYSTCVAVDGTTVTLPRGSEWDSATGRFTVYQGREFISGNYYWVAW